jgi:hypothetical protein
MSTSATQALVKVSSKENFRYFCNVFFYEIDGTKARRVVEV